MTSSVELTQDLVRLRTINPPGDERACAERLASLLEGAGFAVDLTPFGEGRAHLVARAAIGIDIRTIPGQSHAKIRDQLASYLGGDVALSTLLDAESVWTSPDDAWISDVFRITRGCRFR